MAWRIEVIKKGKPIRAIISDIKNLDKLTRKQIRGLGDRTKTQMRSIIDKNKLRPQLGERKLENTINVDHFPKGGWGVAKIIDLDKNAVYWKAINWGTGGRHPAEGKKVPPGAFKPGESKPDASQFRTGRWLAGAGNYSFYPKNPIPAMNYIEKTIHWLGNEINKLIVRMKIKR